VKDADLIWHLAAVVSSEAEADFDLGMRVNLQGLLHLLEASRASGLSPRLVYASGFAVFGGELPATVTDATAPEPKSSYGTQKAIGELLVADFSRRGFIDGRTLRLPTIAVRPGKPNKAASTFVSSIIREPLKGQRAVCPVTADTQLYVSSPRRALESMLLGMTLGSETIGVERTIPLPGLRVSVAGMIAALERAAGKSAADFIRWEPDPTVQRIVDSWPVDVQTERAARLGFRADSNFDQIVQAHIEDENIHMSGAAGGS
jgi:nucleoside-diphosphate-sugar epimerase